MIIDLFYIRNILRGGGV